MNTISITDKDLDVIIDCIKAVKSINFDNDKYDKLLLKIEEGKTLPIQNVRQSDLSGSNSIWGGDYTIYAEFCNNCNTQNIHTHKKTGKKCCACCGAC